MSEMRDLIKLVVLVAVIGILGLVLVQAIESSQYSGSLTVDYTARIYFSNVVTLEESYTYHVNKYRYKMLYWDAPLTLKMTLRKINTPCIVLKSIGYGDRDVIAYMKFYNGKIYFSKKRFESKKVGRDVS